MAYTTSFRLTVHEETRRKVMMLFAAAQRLARRKFSEFPHWKEMMSVGNDYQSD